MNVLCIEPGNGSYWLTKAEFVRRDGTPSIHGRFVRGYVWVYDGAWNMPDDYSGQYELVTYPRKWIRKIERAAHAA